MKECSKHGAITIDWLVMMQSPLRLSDVFDVAVCDSLNDDVVTEKFGSPAYIPPEVDQGPRMDQYPTVSCRFSLLDRMDSLEDPPISGDWASSLSCCCQVSTVDEIERSQNDWGSWLRYYRLVFAGKYPFYDSNPRGVFKRIRRAHVCFPSGLTLSRSARDIVHCMLRKRPADRPNAILLSQIPWWVKRETSYIFTINRGKNYKWSVTE